MAGSGDNKTKVVTAQPSLLSDASKQLAGRGHKEMKEKVDALAKTQKPGEAYEVWLKRERYLPVKLTERKEFFAQLKRVDEAIAEAGKTLAKHKVPNAAQEDTEGEALLDVLTSKQQARAQILQTIIEYKNNREQITSNLNDQREFRRLELETKGKERETKGKMHTVLKEIPDAVAKRKRSEIANIKTKLGGDLATSTLEEMEIANQPETRKIIKIRTMLANLKISEDNILAITATANKLGFAQKLAEFAQSSAQELGADEQQMFQAQILSLACFLGTDVGNLLKIEGNNVEIDLYSLHNSINEMNLGKENDFAIRQIIQKFTPKNQGEKPKLKLSQSDLENLQTELMRIRTNSERYLITRGVLWIYDTLIVACGAMAHMLSRSKEGGVVAGEKWQKFTKLLQQRAALEFVKSEMVAAREKLEQPMHATNDTLQIIGTLKAAVIDGLQELKFDGENLRSEHRAHYQIAMQTLQSLVQNDSRYAKVKDTLQAHLNNLNRADNRPISKEDVENLQKVVSSMGINKEGLDQQVAAAQQQLSEINDRDVPNLGALNTNIKALEGQLEKNKQSIKEISGFDPKTVESMNILIHKCMELQASQD